MTILLRGGPRANDYVSETFNHSGVIHCIEELPMQLLRPAETGIEPRRGAYRHAPARVIIAGHEWFFWAGWDGSVLPTAIGASVNHEPGDEEKADYLLGIQLKNLVRDKGLQIDEGTVRIERDDDEPAKSRIRAIAYDSRDWR